jgi:hypothetical protein
MAHFRGGTHIAAIVAILNDKEYIRVCRNSWIHFFNGQDRYSKKHAGALKVVIKKRGFVL